MSRRILLLLFLMTAACGEKPAPESEPASEPAAESPAPPEAEPEGEEVAVIQTKSGQIVLRFFESEAPRTVAEFKKLARAYFYNGTTFHRVVPGKLIQGGDPLSRDRDPYNDGTGKSATLLPAEFSKLPFKRGTVGLARGPDPNSGSCQFFICLTRTSQWDGDYTAFAEVIEGIDVVEKISQARTNPNAVPQLRERPLWDQVMDSVRIERRKLE